MHCQVLNVNKIDSGVESRLEARDSESIGCGEVLVRVQYSGLNYKDALAVTGRGRILRRFPLIPGIDLAGEVVESSTPDFKPGDRVLANGCGLGEDHDGGFAEYARIPAAWTIAMPKGLSCRRAMILGTAGFTAALALERMEVNGQKPSLGPIAVTGASGGVGSIALKLLVQRGYRVIAISGRAEQVPRLLALGAEEVISAADLGLSDAALQSVRFGGVIDNIGGTLLPKLMGATALWGNVASIGLAAGADYAASVFPQILRGVSLLGVSSANCPMLLRKALWQRCSEDLALDDLEALVSAEVTLAEVVAAAEKMLARQSHGRILVKLC